MFKPYIYSLINNFLPLLQQCVARAHQDGRRNGPKNCKVRSNNKALIDLYDCDVDEGQVEVDELKAEHLECVALLKVSLGSWLFKFNKPQGNILIQLKFRD